MTMNPESIISLFVVIRMPPLMSCLCKNKAPAAGAPWCCSTFAPLNQNK